MQITAGEPSPVLQMFNCLFDEIILIENPIIRFLYCEKRTASSKKHYNLLFLEEAALAEKLNW